MYSGQSLAEDFIGKPKYPHLPAHWSRWAEGFREISQQEDEFGSLACDARQAYERMTALRLEIEKARSDSSDGSASSSTKANGATDTSLDATVESKDAETNGVQAREDVQEDAVIGSNKARNDGNEGVSA